MEQLGAGGRQYPKLMSAKTHSCQSLPMTHLQLKKLVLLTIAARENVQQGNSGVSQSKSVRKN